MTPVLRRLARAAAALLLLLPIVACGSANPVQPQPPGRGGGSWYELQPACSNPAPLSGTYDSRAPGVVVTLKEDVYGGQLKSPLISETVSALAAKYNFTPRYVYTAALAGFSAVLTPEQIASLRCDPAIKQIYYDVVGSAVTP